MTHHVLFLDFESYYDSEFQLRKMAPPNYILDPRFETIGCSFKIDGGPACYIDAPDIPAILAKFDPAKTTTVAFNALFDNCILAWRYGFVPARMVCTMRLAVALRGHELRDASLATVGRTLGVGVKGSTIADAKGKHRADIVADPDFYRAYQAYANNDNEMSAAVFHTLYPELPVCERRVMDLVLRCAVEPAFVCDTAMLEKHLAALETDKVAMLDEAAGHVLGDAERETFKRSLRSGSQFEATLRRLGVDIEYKASPTTGEAIPAFSKSDDFMIELQEHEDPVVRLLAAARLELRSTIESTRGERILSMAQLPWGDFGNERRSLPIPLKYAAAHTHRLGGDWKLNFQNLPAGRGGQVSMLRKALCAPEGHKVVVADKSQIECRINAWLCGQHDLVKVFADGGDPYSRLASSIFGYPVNKKDHPVERFIGKTGELGLGFGCGHVKFHNMVVRSARGLGLDMNVLAKIWNPDVARRAVVAYRNTHGAIQETWRQLDSALKNTWKGPGGWYFGPCVISRGCVEGPNGLKMNYSQPREELNDHWATLPERLQARTELCYNYGSQRYTIYGSKLLENIVQFLARINTMHDALRICNRGYRFVMQAHDELVWIVPDDKVDDCKRVVLEEMTRPPSWGRDIPLAAECGVGQSYGDAK